MSRFKVTPISQSRHCCFAATVVDTTMPTMIGNEQYFDQELGELQFQAVCECFDEEDANLICNALNNFAEALEPR